MKVRVINETGRPGDTRVEDENGDGIHCIGVEVKVHRSESIQANVFVEAVEMNIVGDAKFWLLDPRAGKMKGIKRIEFTDGSAFDVPEVAPKLHSVSKAGDGVIKV